MANTNPPIDYTSKDYDSFKASMLEYASTAFPDWNPSSEGDFGVVLVELFAYALDIGSYYGDRISQEAYIRTATQRVSILNIAELLGYIPTNGLPSTGTVTLVTDNPHAAVVVPAGTQLITDYMEEIDTVLTFETDEEVTVTGNGGTLSVAVTQGESHYFVVVGNSSGLPEQQFALTDLNVFDGTVSIFIETTLGYEEWTEIQFLVDADPDDKVYSVRNDEQGRTIITFGDNLNGLIPGTGLKIFSSYRTGYGSLGNLPESSVKVLSDVIEGVAVQLNGDHTANTSEMTGGADPESIEQIRANAPLAFRTQFRAVTVGDFHDLALKVPGVVLAKAIANHYTNVTLYVVGVNGLLPDDSLKDRILDYFEDKTLAGVSLTIKGPTYVDINLTLTLAVQRKYSRPDVLANVTRALENLYSLGQTEFAMSLSVSDVYYAIMSVEGVLATNVTLMARSDAAQLGTADIQLREAELPTPGTFTITATGGIA